MTHLEIILSALTAILSGTSLIEIFTIRALRKKAQADAVGAMDQVLINRINFLDNRLTTLEKRACFRENCDQRM
jgi:hypothetical protein